ncbi:MAG: PD-(D/E)XK motif protein [Anaerolineales bacterium]|nr:PD-(D/E)XK motif protein [Anaerolineales bacterium]
MREKYSQSFVVLGVDSVLQTYFLHILSTIIVSLDNPPNSQDIIQAIKILVELFRALTRPPRKSIQGLWAELYLMARSNQSFALVKAWHIRPEDRYDFSLGNQRIEIKSTSHRVRQHHFSFRATSSPAGTEVLIASLFVERSQAGQSLVDLLEKIRSCIIDRPDLLLHMDEIVGLTLGSSWRHISSRDLMKKLAEESLAFYEASAVPSVNPEIPITVSNVHFMTDLTDLQPVNLTTYQVRVGCSRLGYSRMMA